MGPALHYRQLSEVELLQLAYPVIRKFLLTVGADEDPEQMAEKISEKM